MPESVEPLQLRHVPAIYFNGFELALSNSDVVATLSLSNGPAANVYMSYTTAKSLAEALTGLVSQLERVTDRSIMTSNEVAAGMEKLGPVDAQQ